MFGRIPSDAQPGSISSKLINKQTHLLKNAFDKLSSTYKLPSIDQITLEELIALADGRRWAPDTNEAAFTKIFEQFSKKDTVTEEGQNLSENQSSRLLRDKLCLFLLSKNLPILILPKPGQDFNLVYVTFCCSAIDPGNILGWKEDIVRTDPKDYPVYYARIAAIRARLVSSLKELGIDTRLLSFKNSVIDLFRLSVALRRYHYQKKSGSGNTEYVNAQISRLSKAIKLTIQSVGSIAFAVYVTNGGQLLKRIHGLRVGTCMCYLFAFDPYYGYYDSDEYNSITGGLDKVSKTELALLKNTYTHAKEEYTNLYYATKARVKKEFVEKEMEYEILMPQGKVIKFDYLSVNDTTPDIKTDIPKMRRSEIISMFHDDKKGLTTEVKKAARDRLKELIKARKTPKFTFEPMDDINAMPVDSSYLSKRASGNAVQGQMNVD
jgi:hypothetical protein